MPYNRDTYALVLEKAKATLKAKKTEAVVVVEDPLADDLKQLKADARALAKTFGKDERTFGTETFKNLDALTKAINALKPTDGDVRQRVAEYRAELDAAATWYDVEFKDVGPPGPPPAKAGSIFDDIRQTPDVLGKVTPYQLLNYNLANALLHPAGRSKFYQRDRPMTLATASLAATAWLNRDAAPATAPAAPAAAAPAAVPAPTGAAPATATAAGVDELSLLTWLFILPSDAQEGVLRFFRANRLATVKELFAFIDNDTQKNKVGRPQRLLDRLNAAGSAPLPTIESLSEFFAGAAIVNKRS